MHGPAKRQAITRVRTGASGTHPAKPECHKIDINKNVKKGMGTRSLYLCALSAAAHTAGHEVVVSLAELQAPAATADIQPTDLVNTVPSDA